MAIVSEPDGVNMRAEPGATSSSVRALSYETVVKLRVDETDTVYTEGSRWWPVAIDGLTGWVSGTYLAPTESEADTTASTDDVTDTPGKVTGAFAPGSYVAASTDDGTGLNIRADGAPDAEEIGIVPESDVVQVMDGPYYDPIGNPWYMITNGQVTGYVSGWYLTQADQPGEPLSKDIPSKVTVPGAATGSLEYPLQAYTLTQGFGCSPLTDRALEFVPGLQLPQWRRSHQRVMAPRFTPPMVEWLPTRGGATAGSAITSRSTTATGFRRCTATCPSTTSRQAKPLPKTT